MTIPVGMNPRTAAMGDLNSDGILDVVVANWGSGNVSVVLNDGKAVFAAATSFAAGLNPYSVSVRDVNGDGQPDVVVANQGGGDVRVLLNSSK